MYGVERKHWIKNQWEPVTNGGQPVLFEDLTKANEWVHDLNQASKNSGGNYVWRYRVVAA